MLQQISHRGQYYVSQSGVTLKHNMVCGRDKSQVTDFKYSFLVLNNLTKDKTATQKFSQLFL
jgi:hypothetical protein